MSNVKVPKPPHPAELVCVYYIKDLTSGITLQWQFSSASKAAEWAKKNKYQVVTVLQS